MIKKTLFWVVLVAGVAVAGYCVYRHYTATDEDRVREVIEGLAGSLENNTLLFSLQGIERRLSVKYRHRGEDAPVLIDRQVTVRFVHGLKRQLTDFKVEFTDVDITVSGDTAQAVVTGRITAAKKDDPATRIEVMTQPGMNRAVIDLAKEDDDWLVTGSERVAHTLEAAQGE